MLTIKTAILEVRYIVTSPSQWDINFSLVCRLRNLGSAAGQALDHAHGSRSEQQLMALTRPAAVITTTVSAPRDGQ